MAVINPTINRLIRDDILIVTWTGLTLRTGTCTCPGGSPVLNWLTVAHGLTAANIGTVVYLTPTGGTAGLYTLTAVGSTTTATFSYMAGTNVTLVTGVVCTMGDVGASYAQADAAFDRTIQAHGTFGASGAISLYGSLDNTNFAQLTDNFNIAISATTTKVRNVFDGPLYFSPMVSAGDGTTSLSFLMMFRIQFLRPQ